MRQAEARAKFGSKTKPRPGVINRLALRLVFVMIALLTVQRYDLSAVNIAIGSTRISELLAMIAVSLLFVDAAAFGRRLRVPRLVTQLVILFLGVMFLSSFESFRIENVVNHFGLEGRRPERELPFIKSYTTMLSWGLGITVFYAVILVVNTPARLRRALKWWVIGGTVCSAVAIYSAPAATFGWPLGRTIGVALRAADVTGPDNGLPRVYGLTGEPRHLVSFLVSMLPFLFLATTSDLLVMGRRAQRVCLAICSLAFLLTLSRSTVVYGAAMVASILFVTARGSKGIRLGRIARMTLLIGGVSILSGGLVQVALMIFGLPDLITIGRYQLQSLTGTDRNLSNWFQIIGFKVAWAAFLDHPVLGVGIGNLSFYVDRYIYLVPRPDWLPDALYYVVTPVNSVYLDILSEMGILGLTSFLLLFGVIGTGGWRAIREARPAGRCVVSGLLCGVFMLLFAYVLFSAFMYAYVWAAIAFLVVAARLVRRQPDCFENWGVQRARPA